MKVAILTPVFNDWESLRILLRRLDALKLPNVSQLRVVVVNDGSTVKLPADMSSAYRSHNVRTVELLDLSCNLGHQRAIILGLGVISAENSEDLIVVMDCDGEDQPDDVARLIAACHGHPGAIAVAERIERSEGVRFRMGYWVYRIVFRLLTGQNIRFGNFCAMDIEAAARLAATPNAWNHLAATLVRSGYNIVAIPTRRAHRFAGRTSNNFASLMAHGLSALAVFSDHVFARLLLASAFLSGLAVIGGILVIFIRFGTDLAIPGWATTVFGMLGILLMQALLLLLVGAMQLLASRNQATAVPSQLIDIFVRSRRPIPSADG